MTPRWAWTLRLSARWTWRRWPWWVPACRGGHGGGLEGEYEEREGREDGGIGGVGAADFCVRWGFKTQCWGLNAHRRGFKTQRCGLKMQC
eukprot:364298-Chlamydomonas_euryale.AAC.8